MRVTGLRTKLKVKVRFGMQKETSMWVNSRLTRLVDLEFTHMLMAVGTKVSGSTMCSKDKVKRLGSMVPSM